MVVVAVVAGAVTSVAGFGIGSLLTPLLSLRMGTRLTVAVVSILHLVATALRFGMLRQHIDRRALWGFGLTSAVAGLTGALLRTFVESRVLTAVFGGRLVFAGRNGLTGLAERMRFGQRTASIASTARPSSGPLTSILTAF